MTASNEPSRFEVLTFNPEAVLLYGYHYSVYVRVVRLALLEKGVAWQHVEIDPFAKEIPADYLAMNPFGRVPTLRHGDFTLYETTAITRYIDEAFDGLPLQPSHPRDRARAAQIVAIADSYAYWPLVRQVYSHRVFRPAEGVAADEHIVEEGLASAPKVLTAIEALLDEGPFLCGVALSLADVHLAPMIACFNAAPDGAAMLARFPKLSKWWQAMRRRPALAQTDPGLPRPPSRL